MNHRADEHRHHEQHHHQSSWLSQAHKDWRTWVAVALALAAMAWYILSDNESLQPDGAVKPAVPAAP